MHAEYSPEQNELLLGLHHLLIDHFDDLPSFIPACLETGRQLLGLSTGILSCITDDDYEVVDVLSPLEAIRRGDHFALRDTYCDAVIREGQPTAYHAVGQRADMQQHPVYVGLQLESYIGVPVYTAQGVFGTLNFSDLKARERPFGDYEIRILEVMASMLGRLIERERREHRLFEREQLFEKSFRHGIVPKAMARPDGVIIDVNDAFCRMFGYQREQVLGLRPSELTHPDDQHITEQAYRELFSGMRDYFVTEKRYVTLKGNVIETQIAVALVRNEYGDPGHIVFEGVDLTDKNRTMRALEAANARLHRFAQTDALTGLPNRRAFDEALERECARARRTGNALSIAIIDLDHFKRINDRYGHGAGDEVLVALAEVLRSGIRRSDMAARLGGEEFVVLLPETTAAAGAGLAERLREALHAASWPVDRVTASFGVAQYDAAAMTPKTLLARADEALYAAKAAGRDRVMRAGQ
ncbi:PAS domain S-box-containing protein/diguanylate cyclase (GGDEF)-like protein [Kushneria sinocarnis]|uniref:diguanylate cyclase n=1 Tax=Kushneria sinocarnis TaxID=595502 RepID=A0A420X1C4_9GAMM|nr:sensor domain-containing diguanylate cyclase [Kushneria sinocarnis]RKR07658.1 PAS domain S-box-containing protein/diguanylate cyclase (GGDEF)-like protein [Kushneria sinocarnis]